MQELRKLRPDWCREIVKLHAYINLKKWINTENKYRE